MSSLPQLLPGALWLPLGLFALCGVLAGVSRRNLVLVYPLCLTAAALPDGAYAFDTIRESPMKASVAGLVLCATVIGTGFQGGHHGPGMTRGRHRVEPPRPRWLEGESPPGNPAPARARQRQPGLSVDPLNGTQWALEIVWDAAGPAPGQVSRGARRVRAAAASKLDAH